MRLATAAIGMAVVVAACAGDPAGVSPVASPGAGTTQAGGQTIPRCDEVPAVTAPAADYADEPIYVANEMPVERVEAWAQAHAGYEAIWIDRDHNGWVTVAFSEGLDARRSEIPELFPGEGIVAVGVDWRMSELQDLQARATSVLPEQFDSFGTGISITQGVVSVDIPVLSGEALAFLAEQFAGERVCVNGQDPASVPPSGPQPQAGDGWRLLADERGVGQTYRTGIATDTKSYADLWLAIGIPATMPEVDFESEVVVWFGAVFGSGCEDIRLDDVVVDGSLLYADIVLAEPRVACNDDANPHAYVVAVERSKLPAGPFSVQLDSDGPPAGAPEERTTVDADLTAPGSTVRPAQITVEPNESEFVLEYGATLEPGVGYPIRLDMHCGIEWLGEFNNTNWFTADPTPPAWQELIGGFDPLDAELVLSVAPEPLIEVSALGASVVYTPTSDPVPGCD